MSFYTTSKDDRIPARAFALAKLAYANDWTVALTTSIIPREVVLTVARADETWRARWHAGPKLGVWALSVEHTDGYIVSSLLSLDPLEREVGGAS